MTWYHFWWITLFSYFIGATLACGQPLELDPGSAKLAGQSKTYRIGIIDTGYLPSKATEKTRSHLCKDGHYDYLTDTPNLNYTGEHGTRIMNLISAKLAPEHVDYCFVVYQVTTNLNDPGAFPETLAKALLRALAAKLVTVNVSLDSENTIPDERERSAFAAATSNGLMIFLAAGNSGNELGKSGCKWYPACYGPYKNLILVGAQKLGEVPMQPEKAYNWGSRVSVYAPAYYDDDDIRHTGTSYATPRALAEYILFLESKRGKK